MSPSRTIQAPPAAKPSTLPASTSPSLELVLATPEELEDCAALNNEEWSGPLPLETYIRREKHIHSTPLSRDGGISAWVLVDKAATAEPRVILSACESLRKKAIVAHRDGTIRDVVTHGIGSVYCRSEYRGKGYAARMMQELSRKLEYWQQPEGGRALFSVLYSDIGKVQPAISLFSSCDPTNISHTEILRQTWLDSVSLCAYCLEAP